MKSYSDQKQKHLKLDAALLGGDGAVLWLVGQLTTDLMVLCTARILFPMENLMHLTSPLSSILRTMHTLTLMFFIRCSDFRWQRAFSPRLPEGNAALVIGTLDHDPCGSAWTHRKHLQTQTTTSITHQVSESDPNLASSAIIFGPWGDKKKKKINARAGASIAYMYR